jgi:hypothetical protein
MADYKITAAPLEIAVSENDLHKTHRFSVPKDGHRVRLAGKGSGGSFFAQVHPGQTVQAAIGDDSFFAVADPGKETQLTVEV